MPPDSETTQVALLQAKIESVQELIELKHRLLQKQMMELQGTVKKLVLDRIDPLRCDKQDEKLNQLNHRLDNHDRRAAKYDLILKVIGATWTIVSAIIMAILIALATGKAHIVWH